MAKRMTKAEQKAFGALLVMAIVIGTPILVIGKLVEMVGWPLLVGSVVACFVARYFFRAWRTLSREADRQAALQARRSHLLGKYGNSEIVERIMSSTIWREQTAEQLRDTLGDPVDTDEKLMKTKRRVVWKYHQTGVNRFGLRVTLENDRVVGWDEKL